jgi:hypothetical protein
MAVTLSQYVDPGVYVQQVIVPGPLNLATVPVLPTIIAHGSRLKQAINEAVIRGLVSGETLTVAGASPHTAQLANRSNRKLTNTTVYGNGVAISDSFISYQSARILGTAAGTFNISSPVSFSIELDGNLPIQIVLEHAAVPVAPVVSEAQVTVEATFSGVGGSAATRAEVAAAINAGLAAATNAALGVTSGGYGSSYSAVASDGTTGIRIISPISTPSSDVRVFASVPGAAAGLTALFGGTLDAASIIIVSDTIYSSSVTYTADYIALTDVVDTLSNDDPRTFTKVGRFPGVGTFTEDTDFAVDGNSDLDWSNATATGVITSATTTSLSDTYNLSVNDTIQLAFDGKAAVTIDLNGLVSPPVGYANPAVPAAATAAEVAANINAVLANDNNHGARYRSVAVASGGRVVLTSPNDGSTSSIAITHPSSSDATLAIFGLGSSTNLTVTGTGTRPDLASVYYATYSYPRPAGDYNVPKQFFSLEQALSFTGPISASNPLAVAAEIAFRNGAPTVLLIQVDDSSAPGAPTRLEILDALNAAGTKSTATDIVVLSTDLAVQVDVMQHVENQSSLVEKNYRRGWFGMARDTAIGDKDTADTFVYRATRTLQVAPDSPARGRLILVSPPGIEGNTKTLTLEDGTTEEMELDSSWNALMVASKLASFTSPAESLLRKTVSGVDADENDFTPWVRAERASLASAGVTVVTFDAGRFILLDPTTTERGGGGLVGFEEISVSVQKDNVVRKVTQALDAGVIGLVPTDLADFVLDIKQIIANVLQGEIGRGAIAPFVDDNGNTRDIDYSRDIKVEQDANDPRTFLFKFFFRARYPARLLLGEYSLDNPFFNANL